MNGRVTIINVASVLAILSLLAGLGAAIATFTGAISFDSYKLIFNLASLAWFLTSPLWFVPQLFGERWKEAGKGAWLRPKS
ncbi:MAG TPA: hypothetical protein VM658_02745 [bacterium]|nr:hypothetical protein [bacterium]